MQKALEVFILLRLLPIVAGGGGISLFSKTSAVGSLPLKIFREIGDGGGVREERAVARAPGAGDLPAFQFHATNGLIGSAAGSRSGFSGPTLLSSQCWEIPSLTGRQDLQSGLIK